MLMSRCHWHCTAKTSNY